MSMLVSKYLMDLKISECEYKFKPLQSISLIERKRVNNNVVESKSSRCLPIINSLKWKRPVSQVGWMDTPLRCKKIKTQSARIEHEWDYSFDMCTKCNIARELNREDSRVSCPQCGDSIKFPSYMLDLKDNDKDDMESAKQQKHHHMSTLLNQYERGFIDMPVQNQELLSIRYQSIHTLDISKTQVGQTTKFMKQDRLVFKSYIRAAERINKQLISQAVPEFDNEQINYFLVTRSKLKSTNNNGSEHEIDSTLGIDDDDTNTAETLESSDSTTNGSKKSLTTNMIIRHVGSCRYRNSRMFAHAKTYKIHSESIKKLEKCTNVAIYPST